MMGLTRKTEYAIRGMLYLAKRQEGEVAMLDTIADAVEAPRPFLAKILQSLASKGLIRSARGQGGLPAGEACSAHQPVPDRGGRRGPHRAQPVPHGQRHVLLPEVLHRAPGVEEASDGHQGHP
jgi:hypothetical protein